MIRLSNYYEQHLHITTTALPGYYQLIEYIEYVILYIQNLKIDFLDQHRYRLTARLYHINGVDILMWIYR